ncbi:MAG TPA: hypothetical protein VGU67_12435 [Edaphobacter sp.]|nr:hypothetical protein [Edaphobacter sp.]
MRIEVRGKSRLIGKVSMMNWACCAVFLCLTIAIPAASYGQVQGNTRSPGSEPIPQPAIPSILAAFDRYEVVGISEAHGMKDVDDLILSLIRDPRFSEKVNDIAVECGNSLYQPILDRYIAGEDVPFTEVQKVWRNTTQPMCGESGFFEQFFPLIRAINQKLPPGKRLRVLAADPPIDWDQVKNSQDIAKFADRDANIASVMEREVLAKHRKALMLFGIFHLMHGSGPGDGDAVTLYEKRYPNLTFVISDLGYYGTDLPSLSDSPFSTWPIPSLAKAGGSRLGALYLSDFFPSPIGTDKNCNVVDEFAGNPQKRMEDLVDAFLYLGPQNLRLTEPMPADIALDTVYMTESMRRIALMGLPGTGTLKEFDQQIVKGAENPVFVVHKMENPEAYFPFIKQSCLDRKSNGNAPR